MKLYMYFYCYPMFICNIFLSLGNGYNQGYWVSTKDTLVDSSIRVNQKCSNNDAKARRDIKDLTTHVLVSDTVSKDKCAEDISVCDIIIVDYRYDQMKVCSF